ncbi:WXG100 family type VII secretion target [Kitasatospora sp. P5_F3]
MSDYTNFNGYSHGDLRRMVGSMDSGGVMSAADPWRRASDTLKQIRTSLSTASGDAVSSWEGNSSDAFHTKMITLANGINNAAAYANDAAVTLELMSTAIDEAKRTMPEEPSFWSKAADAIGDTAASATGTENEDTKTAVTDEKKAQAVAVMNLLATRYRTATDYLKPPPRRLDELVDSVAPDSSGSAAIGALIMGGGAGLAGGGRSGGTSVQSRSTSSVGTVGTQSPNKFQPSGPTDPGIKGGTANPPPKPKSPGTFGPGTGIDGVNASPRPAATSTSASGTHVGSPASGTGAGSGFGGGTGGLAGGGSKAGASGGFAGSGSSQGSEFRKGATGSGSRPGGAFGASGMPGAGGGAAGTGAARRAGGAVGSGGSGRGAFTEGGSGIGRGRGQAGQGTGGQGGGMPAAGQSGNKDKKDKRRPDYLVEDEETWATGASTNPNVVE